MQKSVDMTLEIEFIARPFSFITEIDDGARSRKEHELATPEISSYVDQSRILNARFAALFSSQLVLDIFRLTL